MRVELDRRAIEALGEDGAAAKGAEAVAKLIAADARTHAPGHTGSWIAAHERNVGYDSSFGHWIEWGTIYSPAYAPLRRALAGMGLQLREGE